VAGETATAFFTAWMNVLMVGVEHNVVLNVAGSLGRELEILFAGIRWVVIHGLNRTLTRSG
jgi:hypothetical protein